MVNFRTEIFPAKSENNISYNTQLFFIGSCFAENIGNFFLENKFSVEINPFGVIYNPVSIKNSLDILISKRQLKEEDLFFHNDLWASFYHHGSFSRADIKSCLENINNKISSASDFLLNSDFLFITFGSARVYELKEGRFIVSNCHKLPAGKFYSYDLDPEKIVGDYSKLIDNLLKFNPKLRIIFTVSPIRYLNYGEFNNSVSKSSLFLSISELLKKFDTADYFPAYEIMMDDLREYRFYKEDMIHPNEIAIKYLQGKICEAFIGKSTMQIISEIGTIIKAKNHRPINLKSEAHRQFLNSQTEKIRKIQAKYKYIDLQSELDHFENQLRENF